MSKRSGKVVVAMSGGVDSSVAACLFHEQGYEVTGLFMRTGVDVPEETARAPSTDDQSCDRVYQSRDRVYQSRDRVYQSRDREGADVEGRTLPDGRGSDKHGRGSEMGSRTVSLNVVSPASPPASRHRGCCSAVDAADARRVAGRLGVPFYALNFSEQFDELIEYFAEEYRRGRTPNPCVICNDNLKFGRLVDYADAVDADFIATGHYARIKPSEGGHFLLCGLDPSKDQSYVLFGIDRAILPRTLFPIGGLTKPQVRDHARRFGLDLASKPDSQDICFVPDRDYARVVRERRPDAFVEGPIVDSEGRELGRHEGIANFTIGQRRGVNIAAGRPIYVTRIDPATNTVTVGPREELGSSTLEARRVNWLIDPPTEPLRAHVRIRYAHRGAPATVVPMPQGMVRVTFDDPQSAVTPGQAAVFYDNDMVLGGGWIE